MARRPLTISESPMRERLVSTTIAVVGIRSGGGSLVHAHLARWVDVHGGIRDRRAGVAVADRSGLSTEVLSDFYIGGIAGRCRLRDRIREV
jgi:hypothetical protein